MRCFCNMFCFVLLCCIAVCLYRVVDTEDFFTVIKYNFVASWLSIACLGVLILNLSCRMEEETNE